MSVLSQGKGDCCFRDEECCLSGWGMVSVVSEGGVGHRCVLSQKVVICFVKLVTRYSSSWIVLLSSIIFPSNLMDR